MKHAETESLVSLVQADKATSQNEKAALRKKREETKAGKDPSKK
jgi:hypothetical protein